MPLTEYGICVFGHTYTSHLLVLDRLQRRAARVISFDSTEDYIDIFKRLNWMTYRHRVAYFSCIFIYKCLHGLSSSNANSYFNYVSGAYRDVTNNCLNLPKYKLTTCMNSIFFSGVKLWNDLRSICGQFLTIRTL